MEHMSRTLDWYIQDEEHYEHSICAALSLAKKTLVKYYNLTDSVNTYRIAMVLHPRYKTAYFKKLNWTRLWIESARKLVRNEYDQVYAKLPLPADLDKKPAGQNDSADKEDSVKHGPAGTGSCKQDDENMFDRIPDLFQTNSRHGTYDELDIYLKAEPEDVTDLFPWWYARCHAFPRLSRMALDYLTTPDQQHLSMLNVYSAVDVSFSLTFINQWDLTEVAKLLERRRYIYDDKMFTTQYIDSEAARQIFAALTQATDLNPDYPNPNPRPPAIVGTLRSDAATFGATIDFSAFIEALKDIGFRIGDHKSTTNVVALWGPPELLEAAHTIGIARPSSATEWPAADQALIAEELKQKFGLMPADFIQFNGVLAYGSAIFIESDD
ncbi:hypothetical protein ACG7TL_005475 [Trametes sanguinea]